MIVRDDLTTGLQEWIIGFLVGYLVMAGLMLLIEEWVVCAELADRQRIRLVLAEMLEEERVRKNSQVTT